jgi:hypothetical protein
MGKRQAPKKDKPMKTRKEVVERVKADYEVSRLVDGVWTLEGTVQSLGRKAIAKQLTGQFKLRKVA